MSIVLFLSMRFTPRQITIYAIIILLLAFWVYSNRSKINPTGQLEQTEPIDVSNLEIDSEPLSGRPQVEIVTSKGKILVELRPDLAQQTVINFLDKFSSGYCNGKVFHRVEDWVVQGCDPAGDGSGGQSNLPTETSSENFSAGSLGVARKAFPKEVSNDSQFFITKKDSSFLNGEYTYFGKVISGMDIVNSLTPVDTILNTTILSK